jgi:class 3 adenylate cyclase
MFDRRGTGLSDPVPLDALPAWEEWANDVEAVLDAIGSQRAIVYGFVDSGPTAILYTATHPHRVQGLVLANTTARFLVDDGYPWGLSRNDVDFAVGFLEENWGTEEFGSFGSPSAATDSSYVAWQSKNMRCACSPRQAAAYLRQVQLTDVRDALGAVRVPTLVLHRRDAAWITVDQGRYIADRIPGARFEVVPGDDLPMYTEPVSEPLARLEAFVTALASSAEPDRTSAASPDSEPDRALAAVLFTDIVGSTEQARVLGDRVWRNLLESHDAVARALVGQHRGRLVRTTGDGILATFDGPGRAIRCAQNLRDALAPLGVAIRAGLHTGEVERRGDDISGIGVHIAARVVDRAGGGELFTSSAVPLLVAGSGIEFEDRGEHDLKGVGTLRLFCVAE